jgi:hypothetical protein
MYRLFLIVLLGAPQLAFAQSGSDAALSSPTLSFTSTTVAGAGFQPGSTVVFFAVGLVPNGYESAVYRWSRSTMADVAGVATFDSQATIPCKSIWVAVSTSDAHYAVAAPPNCPLRMVTAPLRPLKRSAAGAIDLFGHGRASIDFLYVHPGAGAWTGFAYDGASDSDGDGKADGVATVRLTSLKPVPGASGPPAEFLPGGVIFAIDYHRLDIAVVRLDGAMLSGAR